MIGWFAYEQFYAAFPLFLVSAGGQGTLSTGVIFACSAAVIVALQVPVNGLVHRALERGRTWDTVLWLGIGILGVAAVLPGLGFGGLVPPLVAMGCFAFGEMVYMPLADSSLAELGLSSKVAVNLRQITSAAGESLGALVGVSVFGWLQAAGRAQVYWLGLGGVILVFWCVRYLGAWTRSRRTD
jgi:hypothetical protein